MRLATLQTWAGPRAAVQLGDSYIDLHATDANLPANVRQLLEGGPELLAHAERTAHRADAVKIPAQDAKLLAPVAACSCRASSYNLRSAHHVESPA